MKNIDMDQCKEVLVDINKFPVSVKGDGGFLRHNTPLSPFDVAVKIEHLRASLAFMIGEFERVKARI